VDGAARKALEPFDRGATGENPFAIQYELQTTMQNLVGIVRLQEEMEKAVEEIAALKQRAAKVGAFGNREYNGGWHAGLDLGNLLTMAEVVAIAGAERKESRGGHFRDDYPNKDPKWAGLNIRIDKAADGSVKVTHVPVAEMPPELKQVIEENK
jgi:succinate dehydrogenase / fumarate reductase flavoprotein subunit